MNSVWARRLRSEKVPSGSVPAPRLIASTPARKFVGQMKLPGPSFGASAAFGHVWITDKDDELLFRSGLPDREVDPAQAASQRHWCQSTAPPNSAGLGVDHNLGSGAGQVRRMARPSTSIWFTLRVSVPSSPKPKRGSCWRL